MKYSFITAALLTLAAAPAFAHHMSPAEPDIVDMQGRHEAAIDDVMDRASRPEALEDLRSDNVASSIDTADDASRGDDRTDDVGTGILNADGDPI